MKKTELLENELNLIRSSLDAIKTAADQKNVVKKIVELTNDISQAVIPYWKKVCAESVIHMFYFVFNLPCHGIYEVAPFLCSVLFTCYHESPL